MNAVVGDDQFWVLPTLISSGRAAYEFGNMVGPAEWKHYDLLLVTRGELTISTRQEHFTCSAGSGLLIPPGCSFEGHPSVRGCAIWVQHFLFLEGAITPVNLPRRAFQVSGLEDSWLQALVQRMSELQRDTAIGTQEIEAAVLFSLLLTRLLETPNGSGRVENAIQSRVRGLEQELRGASFPLPDVEALAERLGWSVSHFRARFREVCGQSIGKYLQTLHMVEARRLLGETNLPVKEISNRLGYSDPVAFHRAFQNQAHQTPGGFRKAARELA